MEVDKKVSTKFDSIANEIISLEGPSEDKYRKEVSLHSLKIKNRKDAI